jgi:hypothetical protein
VRIEPQHRSGERFVLISNDGTDPVTGTFAGLPEGALLSALGPEIEESDIVVASNVQFRISYKGGDGNDVVLTTDFPEIAVAADLRLATFTDVDGDVVTIKTKIGQLDPRDFRLVRAGDVAARNSPLSNCDQVNQKWRCAGPI